MKKLKILIIILSLFHFTFSFSQTIYKLPYTPRDVKFFDYDLDGDNDIVVACPQSDTIVIFKNDGYGNLERIDLPFINGSYLYYCKVNDDVFPDIITGGSQGMIYYLNDSNGSFQEEYHIIPRHTTNMRPKGLADIDNNGFEDIIYYTFIAPYGWGIIYNNGEETFTDDFVHPSEGVEYPNADYLNNDDYSDILISSVSIEPGVYIAFNAENEFLLDTLFDLSDFWRENVIIDIDNDGDNDIIFYKPAVSVDINFLLYKNKDGNTFIDNGITPKKPGTRVDVTIDIDGDNYPDLACISPTYDQFPEQKDSIYIFRNNHDWGVKLLDRIYIGDNGNSNEHIYSGDLNGDNHPELFVTGYLNPTMNHVRLLWNDGTGHFIDTNSVYVSQKEIHLKQQIDVFPNPTSGKLSIHSSAKKIQNIQILDLNGRKLYHKKNLLKHTYFEHDMTASLKEAGLYFCVIQLENDEYVFKKIIVTKP